MDTIWEAILNGLFILLSAGVVFLPLVVVIPGWLRLSPFYRNILFALDNIFALKDEIEISSPDGSTKEKCKAGIVSKGRRGFKEVLTIIRAKKMIPFEDVQNIGLAFGDIPIQVTGLSPNYMVFAQGEGKIHPIIYNPFDPNPTHIRELLLDWVKNRMQVRIAIYTSIIAVLWVTIMTLVIYD